MRLLNFDHFSNTHTFHPNFHLLRRQAVCGFCAVLFLTFCLTTPADAYVHPVTGGSRVQGVTRTYDPPEKDWLPGHRGVDLHAAPGTPILAAGFGVVAFAGSVAGTPVISIDHPDGQRTTYQPVFAQVQAGEEVSEGQVIGTLAFSSGDHAGLHWGVKLGNKVYRNPLELLEAPVIRLKPVQ